MEIIIGWWFIPTFLTMAMWLFNQVEHRHDITTPLLNIIGTLLVWMIYFAVNWWLA